LLSILLNNILSIPSYIKDRNIENKIRNNPSNIKDNNIENKKGITKWD